MLNSLSFCLSVKLLISLLNLNEMLAGPSNFGCRFFPFITLNMSFQSLSPLLRYPPTHLHLPPLPALITPLCPSPMALLQWMSAGQTEASIYQQAEDGKTELSLMHFAITNPQWQPPQETTHFISQLKERVQREATAASDTHALASLSESEVMGARSSLSEVWKQIGRASCRERVSSPV